MTKKLLISIITASFFLGLVFGVVLGEQIGQNSAYKRIINPGQVPAIIDIDTALKYLGRARYSHQYYIDHPEAINGESGSLEHQIGCVSRYDAIIDLLKRLKEE